MLRVLALPSTTSPAAHRPGAATADGDPPSEKILPHWLAQLGHHPALHCWRRRLLGCLLKRWLLASYSAVRCPLPVRLLSCFRRAAFAFSLYLSIHSHPTRHSHLSSAAWLKRVALHRPPCQPIQSGRFLFPTFLSPLPKPIPSTGRLTQGLLAGLVLVRSGLSHYTALHQTHAATRLVPSPPCHCLISHSSLPISAFRHCILVFLALLHGRFSRAC